MALTRLANVGLAAARNVALRTARGRYVLVLNPVRHGLRTPWLAPMAAVRPARRARLQAEAAALGIVLGLRGPSWSPTVPSGTGRTAIGPPALAREDRGSV